MYNITHFFLLLGKKQDSVISGFQFCIFMCPPEINMTPLSTSSGDLSPQSPWRSIRSFISKNPLPLPTHRKHLHPEKQYMQEGVKKNEMKPQHIFRFFCTSTYMQTHLCTFVLHLLLFSFRSLGIRPHKLQFAFPFKNIYETLFP